MGRHAGSSAAQQNALTRHAWLTYAWKHSTVHVLVYSLAVGKDVLVDKDHVLSGAYHIETC